MRHRARPQRPFSSASLKFMIPMPIYLKGVMDEIITVITSSHFLCPCHPLEGLARNIRSSDHGEQS